MNQDVLTLKVRLRTVREREIELLSKVEETRELLSKADARRKEDRERGGRWNTIIDNLEVSYRQLKQELESSRISAGRIEGELARLMESLGAEGGSDLVNAEAVIASAADSMSAEISGGEVYTPADEFSEMDVRVGWRDLLHMSLEDLGTLTQAEISQVRESLLPGRSLNMTDTDRLLIDGRLQMAAELRASARPGEVEDLEKGERRRQLILRAAIEKIQHHRAIQMTDEEIRAVLWCQQRLAGKSKQSLGEQRLQRILEAAIALIRRHRKQGSS